MRRGCAKWLQEKSEGLQLLRPFEELINTRKEPLPDCIFSAFKNELLTLLQYTHLYGRSPECTRMCLLRLDDWEKLFPHTEHWRLKTNKLRNDSYSNS